jgi:hypothetical protein
MRSVHHSARGMLLHHLVGKDLVDPGFHARVTLQPGHS